MYFTVCRKIAAAFRFFSCKPVILYPGKTAPQTEILIKFLVYFRQKIKYVSFQIKLYEFARQILRHKGALCS